MSDIFAVFVLTS